MLTATILGLALIGQGNLTGSDLTLAVAAEKSRSIVVAECSADGPIIGSGAVWWGGETIKPFENLKGQMGLGEGKGVSISGRSHEGSPKPGGRYVVFSSENQGRDNIVKIVQGDAETIAAVRRVLDPNLVILPGVELGIEEAAGKSRTIVVAEFRANDIVGSGPVWFGTADLTPSATLKGKVKEGGLERVSIHGSGPEEVPTAGKTYVVFVGRYAEHDQIVKVLAATPATIGAVRRAIGTDRTP